MTTQRVYDSGLAALQLAIGFGVFWKMWDVYGFWWGLCYGLFWDVWAGYKLATYFVGH